MYIVAVTPIQKGERIDELSYFSIRDIAPGSIISVPIRSNQRKALVLSCIPFQNMKHQLRHQDFQLQKVGGDAPISIFTSNYIAACSSVADLYASTIGTVFFVCTPQRIVDYYIDHTSPIVGTRPTHIRTIFSEQTIQDSYSERVFQYKNIMRESIARKESVFCVVPNSEAAETLASHISKGIEKYVTCIHNDLSVKKMIATWEASTTIASPHIFIITYQLLSLPRNDIATVIFENETSSAYTTVSEPHIQIEHLVRSFAKNCGARYISGSSLLSLSTRIALDAGIVEPYAPLVYKFAKDTRMTLFKKEPEDKQDAIGSLLRSSIQTLILKKPLNQTHGSLPGLLIIASRRGYATSVLCSDCGTPVMCNLCRHTLRLHTKKETGERVLTCARCGSSQSAHIACEKCTSWKLKSYGFGIEKVYDELVAIAPDSVYLCDITKEKSVTEAWNYLSDGKCVVSTIGLLHRAESSGKHIATICFPNCDSLRNTGNFDADEHALRQCIESSEICDSLMIQSNGETDSFIETLQSKDSNDFVRSEIALRKSLKLPPYFVQITIVLSGTKETVIRDARFVVNLLSGYRPKPFKELVRVSPTRVEHTTRLSVTHDEWETEDLRSRIKTLKGMCSVRIEL